MVSTMHEGPTIRKYCILVWGRIMGGSKIKCADICDVAQVTDIRTLPN